MLEIKKGLKKTKLRKGDVILIHLIGQKNFSIKRGGKELSFKKNKKSKLYQLALNVDKSFDPESMLLGLQLAGFKCKIENNSMENVCIKIQ